MLKCFRWFDHFGADAWHQSVKCILNDFNVYLRMSCPNIKLILKLGPIEWRYLGSKQNTKYLKHKTNIFI